MQLKTSIAIVSIFDIYSYRAQNLDSEKRRILSFGFITQILHTGIIMLTEMYLSPLRMLVRSLKGDNAALTSVSESTDICDITKWPTLRS